MSGGEFFHEFEYEDWEEVGWNQIIQIKIDYEMGMNILSIFLAAIDLKLGMN